MVFDAIECPPKKYVFVSEEEKKKSECLLTRLPHLKCIRLGSVRSSLLPFKMHKVGYVRSNVPIPMHARSIATPFF